ncbi:hypothetical protein GQ600_19739 [Phytophthora cactorum]|nr:hypothetical protein GQ600_19739 [Phytophthora cactorum]
MQSKELYPQQLYFSLHFNLTPTCYDTSVTPKTPKPFTEPLRSRTSKVDIYIVLLRGADGARTQEHRV